MKMLTNLRLVIICLLCVTTVSVVAQEVKKLPELSLKNVDGESVNVQDYGTNGKISIFNFWATWCGPCKKELNNFAELYEDWQEELNVEIIAVSTDDVRNSAKVKPYVDGQGWDYEVLLDVNEDFKRSLNFQTVPFTIVVDEAGDIIYEHSGYKEGDEYELEEFLKEEKKRKEGE